MVIDSLITLFNLLFIFIRLETKNILILLFICFTSFISLSFNVSLFFPLNITLDNIFFCN